MPENFGNCLQIFKQSAKKKKKKCQLGGFNCVIMHMNI